MGRVDNGHWFSILVLKCSRMTCAGLLYTRRAVWSSLSCPTTLINTCPATGPSTLHWPLGLSLSVGYPSFSHHICSLNSISIIPDDVKSSKPTFYIVTYFLLNVLVIVHHFNLIEPRNTLEHTSDCFL